MSVAEVQAKPAYSIAEIQKMTGLGRTKTYRLIGDGALIARKIGRRTVILHDDYQAFLNNLPVMKAREVAA